LYKPLALAGMGLAVLAGFFHWVVAGPNEVQPEDEAAAQRLLRNAEQRK
jgi:formate dehydrogenase iron-sulfur subunit